MCNYDERAYGYPGTDLLFLSSRDFGPDGLLKKLVGRNGEIWAKPLPDGSGNEFGQGSPRPFSVVLGPWLIPDAMGHPTDIRVTSPWERHHRARSGTR